VRFIRVGADWHAVKKMAIVVSRIDRCTENPSNNAIRTVNFANGSNIVAGTSVTAVYDKVSRSNLCPAPSSALASPA
jgi:hypothetical protein